jgi:hypothetical protein
MMISREMICLYYAVLWSFYSTKRHEIANFSWKLTDISDDILRIHVTSSHPEIFNQETLLYVAKVLAFFLIFFIFYLFIIIIKMDMAAMLQ